MICRKSTNDGFGHAVLGGAGNAIKEIILDSKTAERCKVQDLVQLKESCDRTILVDVTESFRLGMSAHMRSADKNFTGMMVGVKRKDSKEYDVEFFATEAKNVANHVKSFPDEWMLPRYRGITQEAIDYIAPLIVGEPDVIMKDGIQAYVKPYYMR